MFQEHAPCKSGWTDWDAVWAVDSWGPKEQCVRRRPGSPQDKGHFWGVIVGYAHFTDFSAFNILGGICQGAAEMWTLATVITCCTFIAQSVMLDRRHRIDKYLDTLLAMQTARKALHRPLPEVVIARWRTAQVIISLFLPNQSQRSSFTVISYAKAGRRISPTTCHLL